MSMINQHERMAVLHLERGKRYFEQGNIKEAVEALTESYKFDPRRPELLYIMAEIYGAAGFIDPAVDFIQKCLREDTSNTNAWLMLANLYAQKGGAYLELALEQLDTAEQMGSKSAALYYLRGNILGQKGEKAQAIEMLQKCLEIDPKNKYAQHDLAALQV